MFELRNKFILSTLLSFSLIVVAPVVTAANYYILEGNQEDGYTKVTLNLKPGLVADIVNDGWRISAAQRAQLSEEYSNYGDVMIYKLPSGDKAATEDFLARSGPGLAPVFEGPGGNFEIATGRVVVFFNVNTDEDSAWKFFSSYDISDMRRVSWAENAYEVLVAPGLPALTLANDLLGLPRIDKVYPDFWRNGYEVQ